MKQSTVIRHKTYNQSEITKQVLKGNVYIFVQQRIVTSWPTFPTLSLELLLLTCPLLWHLHGVPCATGQARTPPGWRRGHPQLSYSDRAAVWETRCGSHPLKAQGYLWFMTKRCFDKMQTWVFTTFHHAPKPQVTHWTNSMNHEHEMVHCGELT